MKNELYYDLNAIDSKTKYILAHLFVEERTKDNCIEFLSEIKETCYKQILEKYKQEKSKPKKKRKLIAFVSDKFQNYKNAWNKLFYRVSKLVFGVPIACRKYRLEHNNNAIERYNQDIKDRIKTMRHFGSFDGAKHFLNLKRIAHNFLNPHMQLKGKTPAEEAEIVLKMKRQKFLVLITKIAKGVHHSLR